MGEYQGKEALCRRLSRVSTCSNPEPIITSDSWVHAAVITNGKRRERNVFLTLRDIKMASSCCLLDCMIVSSLKVGKCRKY